MATRAFLGLRFSRWGECGYSPARLALIQGGKTIGPSQGDHTMQDEKKTKAQLLTANKELRERLAALETTVAALRQTEEALRASEKSLTMAQEVAKIGSWDWNIEQDTLVWSDETYSQFGLEVGKTKPTYEAFKRFIHPSDRDLLIRAVEKTLEGDEPYSVDARMLRADGTEWIMHAQGIVYRNDAGRPIRLVGTQQDITQRKRAEEEEGTRFLNQRRSQEER